MDVVWFIIIALVAMWLIGLALSLFGPILHILLVAAAVLFVVRMFTDRSRV